MNKMKIFPWLVAIFYLILFLFNFSHKVIIFSIMGLVALFSYWWRDVGWSIFLGWAISLPINLGKAYWWSISLPKPFFTGQQFWRYKNAFIITPAMVLAFFLLVYFSWHFNLWWSNWRRGSWLKWLPILLIIAQLFSSWQSGWPEISILMSANFLSAVIVYLLALFGFTWSRQKLITIKKIFLVLLGEESILALLQFWHGGNFGKSLELDAFRRHHYLVAPDTMDVFRPAGTFAHANILASFLAAGFVFVLVLLYQGQRLGKTKREVIPSSLFFLSLIAAALLVTLSRGAWLALMLVSLFLTYWLEYRWHWWLRKRVAYFFLLVIGLISLIGIRLLIIRLSALAASFLLNGSFSFRWQLMWLAWRIWQHHILFGVGKSLGTVIIVKESHYLWTAVMTPMHNWYMLQLLENGLIVFCLEITWLIAVMYSSWEYIHGRTLGLGLAWWLALLVFSLTGWWEPNLGPQNFFLLFLLLLHAILYLEKRNEGKIPRHKTF